MDLNGLIIGNNMGCGRRPYHWMVMISWLRNWLFVQIRRRCTLFFFNKNHQKWYTGISGLVLETVRSYEIIRVPMPTTAALQNDTASSGPGWHMQILWIFFSNLCVTSAMNPTTSIIYSLKMIDSDQKRSKIDRFLRANYISKKTGPSQSHFWPWNWQSGLGTGL